jgi:hypothetical protein
MHRVRSLAAAALLGLLLLTGCARDADEALRIGDVTVSHDEIESAAQQYATSLTGADVSDPVGRVRHSVAELTVFREVARRYAQERGVAPGPAQYAAAATALNLSQDDPYVRLTAEAAAYRDALLANAIAREPNEAEMRDIYDRLLARIRTEAPEAPLPAYEEIRSQLVDWPEYGKALALRDELMAAIDRYGLTVNPRYQPLRHPLMTVQGQFDLVVVPLGQQGTGAVRPAG